MNTKTESLELPEELVELMDECRSAQACRDTAVKSLFKAKRAIYYGKIAEKARAKFWRNVIDLYPQCENDVSWVYDYNLRKLTKATK